MSNCYKYEGVNHLENCKEYVDTISRRTDRQLEFYSRTAMGSPVAPGATVAQPTNFLARNHGGCMQCHALC